MGESLLSGVSRSSLLDTATMSPALTPLQAQVDVMVGSTEDQLTSLNFVVSSLVGAAAYGLIRMKAVNYGGRLLNEAKALSARAGEVYYQARQSGISGPLMWPFEDKIKRLNLMARVTYYGMSLPVGMMAGSAAYEMTGRSLLSFEGKGSENPNLWSWDGKGGIKDGLIGSAFAFGPPLVMGEGAGRLGLLFSKGSPRPVAIAGTGLMGVLGFLLANKKFSDLGVELGIVPNPGQEKRVK